MGIYIIPSEGDAFDWLQNHDNIPVSNKEAAEMYDDYRSLNMVPLCLQVSWVGYLAAIACSLNEVTLWITNCEEDGRLLEWFLVSVDDLEDGTNLLPRLIREMLSDT